MSLVVIPACGGIKRILSRPMTKWSFEVALLCRCFAQFISTLPKTAWHCPTMVD